MRSIRRFLSFVVIVAVLVGLAPVNVPSAPSGGQALAAGCTVYASIPYISGGRLY